MTSSFEDLRRTVMHSHLRNTGNWCYANCTFLTVVWAMLSLQTSDMAQWGTKFNMICIFLRNLCNRVVTLAEADWFVQLIEQWGQPLRQNDCSEFICAFLTWLNAPAINLRWERRVMTDTESCIHDTGSTYMPVVLQFSSDHTGTGTCSLMDMIRTWHQVQGMSAALLDASSLMCLHIDRMYQHADGGICKSSCEVEFSDEVQIPCFKGTGTAVEWVSYSVVALAAHLGQNDAGHYRSALRLKPMVTEDMNPFQWLLTNDDSDSERSWYLPEWMTQNVTTIWIVRLDSLYLPEYHASVPPNASAENVTQSNLDTALDMEALRQMLQDAPVGTQ